LCPLKQYLTSRTPHRTGCDRTKLVATVGLNDHRTRVICHLPLTKPVHAFAFDDIIKYIRRQRAASVPITGYTHTSLRTPSFDGYWWGRPDDDPEGKERWVYDAIVLLIIDYEIQLGDPRVSNVVQRLKNSIFRCYKNRNCPQKEIWVMAHSISRQDSPSPLEEVDEDATR